MRGALITAALAATATALNAPLPVARRRTQLARRRTQQLRAGGDAAAAAAAIDGLWSLEATQAGPRRARYTREAHEATHAVLWGVEQWEQHTARDRYFRVLLQWPGSRLARGLAPTLAMLAAWSYVVWWKRLTVTANGLGLLASPITLLLAFRVNSCVARFHAARETWGAMIHSARNLAGTIAATAPDEASQAVRARICRYLVAYAWAAKVFAALDDRETLGPVLSALLPAEDADRVAAARKPALAALALLRRETIALPFKGAHVERSVHADVAALGRLYGGIERVVSTPLAPMYMRHYQRGLLLWLIALPCGLLKAGCTTPAKLAAVVCAVSYLMLGIDEIGIQIEQPFAVMPVHDLAKGLTLDAAEELLA